MPYNAIMYSIIPPMAVDHPAAFAALFVVGAVMMMIGNMMLRGRRRR